MKQRRLLVPGSRRRGFNSNQARRSMPVRQLGSPSGAQDQVFRSVWEHSGDAMALSDSQGVVTMANPAYYQLYGFAAADVLGHSFALIFPPEQRESAIEQYRAIFASNAPPPAYESTIRRVDGTERVVESRIEFIESGGQRTAMLSTIRDITERKQIELQLHSAIRLRDQFLSIASHELKTPLTVLLGNSQMLERRATNNPNTQDRERRAIRVIVDQARRLSTLISGLLDISRIEMGQLSIERTPLDLGKLALRVVEESQPSLDRHSIDISVDPEPLTVQGDALRLEQVLQNLIGNAIKYSPTGGTVVVRVEKCGEQACLSVSDQGIGIPHAALEHLFNRFYRAGNVDPDRISGVGIGLFVVKEIVTLHGGTVGVESVEGQGSRFTICLPLLAGD
jgi:PAS domain S-box-containing protein